MAGQPGTLDPGVLFKVRGFVKTDRAYAGGVDFKRVQSPPLTSKLLSAVGIASNVRKGKCLLLL